MRETWRWFGPDDSVTLENIVQAGATGVVTALDHRPTGSVWPIADIQERQSLIESYGLVWSVVESVPLDNAIKTRSGDYKILIDNYKSTLRNLGSCGIRTVCYNFMPVVDWTRTNLHYMLPNRSEALRFDMVDLAIYDVFVLQRSNAESGYSKEILADAESKISSLSAEQIAALEKNIIAGLPGGEGSYNREGIAKAIQQFSAIDTEDYRKNLIEFIAEVVPVAEEAGVCMAIHPDDPPFSIFGLPRVVSTAADARKILAAVPSKANGLTMCAGSYGARSDNDLVAMIAEFGANIYFVHLRNIKRELNGSFCESEHLDGDNDIVGVITALLAQEQKRVHANAPLEIPMRPDHGHTLADERGNPNIRPGYSFAGRMKGLAELRGVIHAVSHLQGYTAQPH